MHLNHSINAYPQILSEESQLLHRIYGAGSDIFLRQKQSHTGSRDSQTTAIFDINSGERYT